ncbi:FKBP-type peptidyl-prolyl cis-trans isomerase [Porphyromonas loveana]|uniref:FKBP-type peptidyl-prolyl cis-trans isomerase n=1 Tax=Porphyromonas loveana TaxID=1884669 RepID=UPI0035A1CC7C
MKTKKNIIIALQLLLLGSTLFFTSCKKSADEEQLRRRENEIAFNAYADSTDFKKVSVSGSTGYVYMRWKQHGTGTVNPIATSRVQVHYQLYRVVGNIYVEGNYDSETPARFTLYRNENDKSIMGFRIALQNMVVGDECEFVVPWYLAYGEKGVPASGSNLVAIPTYSALRFIVKLDDIIDEEAAKK